jgi:hypothetical protein
MISEKPAWTERQAIGKNYDITEYADMKGVILGHANKYSTYKS